MRSLDEPAARAGGDLAQGRRVHASPLGLIGDTPLVRIGCQELGPGRGYWAKLEGLNPGGIKDRSALHMIRRARQRGDLPPGGTIVESTIGTLGLGLAPASIGLGHPVIAVVEPALEPFVRNLLAAYGARIETVAEPDPTSGWVGARRNRVRELLATIPGAWSPDQYDNPDNAEAYEQLGAELLDQLERIDVLVCSVGTGGHSAGIARALRRRRPELRLVGVDAVGSVLFGQSSRRGLMRGLGSSVYPRNVDYAAFDEVHWVNAAEAVSVCRELARAHYVTGGWSVGCVGLVARWLARTRPADEQIVAVFCDGPERTRWRAWRPTGRTACQRSSCRRWAKRWLRGDPIAC